MATAKPDGPLRRIGSFELIPPDMSELRVILLGNSWSQNCFVGNLLLERDDFDSKRKAGHCRISASLQDKNIVIVNTPDLLQLDFTANKLSELVSQTVTLSAPGPHVFLLVLQPENFTEQHKTRLESVLKHFREQAFEHSLVLICSPQTETLGFMDKYMSDVQIRDVIIKCRYRYLWMTTTKEDEEMKNFKRKVLLTRISWMMNSEEHLKHQVYEEAQANTEQTALTQGTSDVMSLSDERGASLRSTVPYTPAIRVVLFGKNDDKKTKIVNILSGNQALHSSSQHCVATCCYVNGKPLTVVTAPDLYSLKEHEIKQEIRNVVSLCSPGPNVLLLLVKPSEFTEENRKTLNFIMSLFGPNAFKHAMVVITHKAKEKYHDHVENIISDCKRKFYNMFEENHQEFKATIENIIQQNKRSFLTVTEEIHTEVTYLPPLKLVLCGSSAAEKSSVVQSMFGGAELTAVSSPGQCVPHQGEVCGRWVSLVELPALSGKPLETVMQQSLSCISLCAPEGVHAFILVLPVGPLTDEHKTELKTIQDTFSSKVNVFTMILFTVDSDPTAPAVVNFIKGDRDLQELCQSCGGGSLIFNTRGQQGAIQILNAVEQRKCQTPKGFTVDMLAEALMERVLQRCTKEELAFATTKTRECLRIVVVGKTGNGKSATANTILGRKHFKSTLLSQSVTKICEKEEGEVDGQKVVIVDTPGLFDTSLKNDEIQEELVKCIMMLAPGPHVFLLVLRIGRLTDEEKQSVSLIKKFFGKESSPFIIVLFTKGDCLDDEETTFESYIEGDDSLKKIIRDCGGRVHVFNNKNIDNRSQVQQLLQKANKMVLENGGNCYTTKMFQEADQAIQKEMERLLQEKEEEMKRKEEELQLKHKQEIEAMENIMKREKAEIDQRIKREISELEEKLKREHDTRNSDQRQREIEDREKREQEEETRQQLKQKVEELEEKIKIELQSKQTIDKQLEISRAELKEQQQAFERERDEFWKQRNSENMEFQLEERIKINELQEAIKRKKEEDEFRQIQEEKLRQELIQNHHQELARLKQQYELKARKQAEEFNEFKEKYSRHFEDLIDQHGEEIIALKEQISVYKKELFSVQTQHQTDYNLLHSLSNFKEESLKAQLDTREQELQEENERKVQLMREHEEEINELKKKYKKDCTIS